MDADESVESGLVSEGVWSYLGHGGGAIPSAIEDAHRAQRRSRQHVGQGSWTSRLASQIVVRGRGEGGGWVVRARPSSEQQGDGIEKVLSP